MNLERYIGRPKGPFLAWDRVNRPMIRQWCEVMGERNPAYVKEEAARKAGYDGVIAPPVMLQVWGMPGYLMERPEGSASGVSYLMVDDLEEAGYSSVVAVSCDQEYFLPLVEDDSIYFVAECESVVGPKQTALGEGVFITELARYYNQRDDLVGTIRLCLLFYKPESNE